MTSDASERGGTRVGLQFGAFDALVERRSRVLIDELKEFVAQPTIAAHDVGLEETAKLVLARTSEAGINAQAVQVVGAPPTIIGEIGSGERTLLVYNHYDVQPPDPLNEWTSAPFDASERDGHLYGRGVADNKGNLMARVQALELYRQSIGELPLRVRVLFEGEEEVGSPHLVQLINRHGDDLRADGCLWETGYRDAAGRPTISLGLKGIAYFDLFVRGTAKDAHSSLGTILPNAAWRLVWALASLKNERDEIAIDGLMEHVRPPTAADHAVLQRLPQDDEAVRRLHGVHAFVRNLGGLELKLKHYYEPTCTICGLTSGYSGEGSKTVLPAVARAKLDFRLVPDLTPTLVHKLLRAHLDRRGFSDVEIAGLDGLLPSRWPADSLPARAAHSAIQETYGVEPVIYPFSPGSGPMAQVCNVLQIPAVGFGCGHAGSAQHAPNENIKISDYLDHIRAFGRFLHTFATMDR